MEKLKTLLQILFNVIILTFMLKSLWYFAPELLSFMVEPGFLTASQVVAVIISFTFSPSKSSNDPYLHWQQKAIGRTTFILFAGAYILAVEAVKWLYMTIELWM